MKFLTLFAILLAQSPHAQSAAPSKNLQMYWIDVEGGASTLVVAPSGQALLIDTGWEVGDRDAKRSAFQLRSPNTRPIDRGCWRVGHRCAG